jgi:hypothetical protein
MPEIKKSGMSGCCVGGYFYDLGGAHSKYRSKNIEEFALKFCELGQSVVNFATTNESQGPERKFLEALGFKQIFHHGNMYAHVVSGQELDKHLQPFKLRRAEIEREKAEKKRKEEEERRKKLAEQQEKERLKRVEAEKKELAKIKLAKVTSNEDVTLRWVQEQYNAYPNISVQTLFNELFGFKQMPNYERRWDDDALLRSINSRLRKRREVAAEAAKKDAAVAEKGKKVVKKKTI